MIMTAEEQIELLDLIKQAQELSQKKTDAIQEIIIAAQAVAAENAALRNENERLKRHLSIAEGTILRLKEKEEPRGVWAPARSVSESIANGWSGA